MATPSLICGETDRCSTCIVSPAVSDVVLLYVSGRAAAVDCLNTWVEQTKLHPFIENEILADALKTENPNLRTEVSGYEQYKETNNQTFNACLLSFLAVRVAGGEAARHEEVAS